MTIKIVDPSFLARGSIEDPEGKPIQFPEVVLQIDGSSLNVTTSIGKHTSQSFAIENAQREIEEAFIIRGFIWTMQQDSSTRAMWLNGTAPLLK